MTTTPEAELILAAANMIRRLPFAASEETSREVDDDGDISVHCQKMGTRFRARFWIVASENESRYQDQLSGRRSGSPQILFITSLEEVGNWSLAPGFSLTAESLEGLVEWATQKFAHNQIMAAE